MTPASTRPTKIATTAASVQATTPVTAAPTAPTAARACSRRLRLQCHRPCRRRRRRRCRLCRLRRRLPTGTRVRRRRCHRRSHPRLAALQRRRRRCVPSCSTERACRARGGTRPTKSASAAPTAPPPPAARLHSACRALGAISRQHRASPPAHRAASASSPVRRVPLLARGATPPGHARGRLNPPPPPSPIASARRGRGGAHGHATAAVRALRARRARRARAAARCPWRCPATGCTARSSSSPSRCPRGRTTGGAAPAARGRARVATCSRT